MPIEGEEWGATCVSDVIPTQEQVPQGCALGYGSRQVKGPAVSNPVQVQCEMVQCWTQGQRSSLAVAGHRVGGGVLMAQVAVGIGAIGVLTHGGEGRYLPQIPPQATDLPFG